MEKIESMKLYPSQSSDGGKSLYIEDSEPQKEVEVEVQ